MEVCWGGGGGIKRSRAIVFDKESIICEKWESGGDQGQ